MQARPLETGGKEGNSHVYVTGQPHRPISAKALSNTLYSAGYTSSLFQTMMLRHRKVK